MSKEQIIYNDKGNQGAKVKQYRKKPVVIEAVLYTGENGEAVIKWCNGSLIYEGVSISTPEGEMIATPGDYIIKGVKGEFYPCKPDIFEATYEPAATAAENGGIE